VAKLLQTNLPFATGPNVTADTFNQLVRILEINLGSIDPDNTLQLTTAERDTLNFNLGQIIYNTTTTTLQYWDGTAFQNLSAIGAVNLNVSDGTSTIGINLNTQTLSLIGGAGITSNASGTSVTFAIDSSVVTLTGTQTLTNKTLTSPTLTSPVLNGTLSGSAFLDEDNMASDSPTAVASQQSIKAYVDSQVGTVDTLAEILANGNTTGGTDIAVSANDDITFTDSSKALFGASSDLQIYHDGTHSYIEETTASGNLYIRGESIDIRRQANGEQYILAQPNGAVSLFYDGSSKLATTNTGIDVTGGINATGDIASDIFKGATYGSNSFLNFDDDNGVGGSVNTTTLAAIGNMNFILDTNDNEPNLFYWLHGNTAPSSATQLMSLDESGNLITTGDLKLGANGIIDTSSGHLIFKGSGVTAGQFTSTGFSVVGNVAISGNFNTSLGGYQVGGQTVITSGRNVQNVVDLTTTGQVEFLSGTGAAQATDKLYIGGSGLNSADAAIYIGNNGGGAGVGWRFYYEGSGSGNNNKLIIRSENQNNPKDALTFTQDGNATFVGTITSGAITSSGLVTADELSVTNDATFNGSVDASGQEVLAGTYVINNIAVNGSSTATTSATTQVAVDTVSKTTFRTVKYLVQITNSTDSTYHATEILVTHDGTTPSITEYATIFTGSAEEATFSADISGSNLRLLATPASTDSMTFKITRTGIKV
tara:strand:- start:1223 stop:3352 length:2130 start_codon:yes stop_codon:yes gene_type:complete